MEERNGTMRKINKWRWLGRYLTKKVAIVIVLVLVIVVAAVGLKNRFFTESKTTKLGFEDIGEMATQAAYCTEVNVLDDSQKLFGKKIPFTQTKYIYSYDVVIKAGVDFEKIKWSVNDTTIQVKLPETKILSCEIDTDSFKVYHEEDSIFTQINLSEQNEALTSLKQEAKDNAIENGILEKARNNAETILTGFFGKEYDLEKYQIKFADK